MTIHFASCKEPQHHHGTVLSIAVGAMPYPRLMHNGIEIFAPSWFEVRQHQAAMSRIELDYNRRKRQDYTADFIEAEYERDKRTYNNNYKCDYAETLKPRLPDIKDWLCSLSAEDTNITLCCFCPEQWQHAGQLRPKFCHRQLVAAIIRKYRSDLKIELH